MANGQARRHPKEFAHHLAIAGGALAELDTLLALARRLEYIDQLAFDDLALRLDHVAQPLHGLIARLADRFPPATRHQQPATGALPKS